MKLRYRRSVLGILWTLAGPAAMAAVYYFVFQVIARMTVPNYIVFLLAGLLPWTFFAQTITQGMESLLTNRNLITKVPVNLHVFNFASSVTNMANLIFALPVILAFSIFHGVELGWSLLLLPYYLLLLFLTGYSLGSLLSVIFVHFRDLRHILAIVMRGWFYATPILYPVSKLPEQFLFVLYVNPVALMVKGAQDILHGGGFPPAQELAIASGWAAAITLVALAVSQRSFKNIIEHL